MLLAWLALFLVLWFFYIYGMINLKTSDGDEMSLGVYITSIIFLILNAIFISYFWLNGVKDFIYVVWFNIRKKKLFLDFKKVLDVDVSNVNDKILLVYCTCNDFEPKALNYSIEQNYKNYDVVILDDSSDDKYKGLIDEYAKEKNIKVVRRKDRKGFKAGNINHYLLSDECRSKNYKYFVILDSDEVIPNDFICGCLKYFKYYRNVGIVQCSHVATNNKNYFMKLFHIGVNSHWNCYQTIKNKYGFSSLLGHGAMVEYESYLKCGGFPEMVAEDLCLSIEMRKIDKYVVFAPNVICQEEYPIDYVAFKKRHSKWTQGNMEFIKYYTPRIARSKMSWFEKLDIILFTYNLPLTAVFGLFLVTNLVVFPLLKIDLSLIYPVWMLVPTIIFFISPTLNDFITWIGRINFFRFVLYFICVIVLYGSMLYVSFVSSILGLFGKKAKFIVTPKDSKKMTLLYALRCQWKEIVFALVLLGISIWLDHSALPVILISGTSILSLILIFFSNKKYSLEETLKIDRETTKIMIKTNSLIKDKVILPYLGEFDKN